MTALATQILLAMETGAKWSTPLKDWTISDWKTAIEILTGTGAVIAGLSAAWTFRQKGKREHAEWLFKLYEKFYEQPKYPPIRDALDIDTVNDATQEALIDGDQSGLFGNYLNFFDTVVMLVEKKQLTLNEAESIFGYDWEVLCRHAKIRAYIRNTSLSGFGRLNYVLDKLAEKRGWNVADISKPRVVPFPMPHWKFELRVPRLWECRIREVVARWHRLYPSKGTRELRRRVPLQSREPAGPRRL
jgi:hypothetical protein